MNKGFGEERQHGMMKGAVILSVAALLTKVLSAFYKVPFQNLTGDEGFYVYQQVYPFYGLAIALALNGLPLFVSKLISEQEEEGTTSVLLKETWKAIAVGSFLCFLALWFGSGVIANWMGDTQLQPVLRMVSYIYLFIPFLATIRGGFQGELNMLPTGVSQVGEQCVRVAVLLGAAYWYTQSEWTVYEMGTIAISSSWVAALTGLSILCVFLKQKKKNRQHEHEKIDSPLSFSEVSKRLLKEGLPITAMTSLMVFFQFIDAFTIYNGLIDSGLTHELAMTIKGTYDRGQPLVQLGLVVGLGLSTSLLPLLRRYEAEGNQEAWIKSAGSVLKLTVLFSGAATAGLIAVMPWINEALFADQNSTVVLQVYVVSILFASFISCMHAIIQSKQESFMPIIGLICGLLFKALMNRFAVRYVGTMGSSYMTVLSLFIVSFFLASTVPKSLWTLGIKWKEMLKGGVGVIIMMAAVFLTLNGLEQIFPVDGRIGAFLLTGIGVVIGAMIYFIFLIKCHVLTERERAVLPFSKYLTKVG